MKGVPCTGGLLAGRGFVLDLDLDLVALDPDGIAADLDARVVRPGAVGQAEPPGMPRAGHDAVLDMAIAERGTHVWAEVIDGVVAAAVAENRDDFVACHHRLALAL